MLFYEAPHRIAQTLHDMAVVLGGERAAAVCRELTKRFETTYRGTLAELARQAAQDADMARGEIVIVVAGAASAREATPVDVQKILRVLASELAPAQAAKLTAKITGMGRAELYEMARSFGRDER